MSLSDNERAIRQRLKDDLEHYAARCLKVRTKAGNVEPLIFNAMQRYLHQRLEEQRQRTGMVRVLVLKGRQQVAEKAAAEGITPIEVQLATMRALWAEANKGAALDLDKAIAASAIAKDAAPYIHPRLASVEASIAVTNHEAALDELK